MAEVKFTLIFAIYNLLKGDLVFCFRLNLAMCCLKQSKWIETRNLCDKVLEENAEVAKAYFRRGEAFLNLNDHELGKM